jgi:hypothetical protein
MFSESQNHKVFHQASIVRRLFPYYFRFSYHSHSFFFFLVGGVGGFGLVHVLFCGLGRDYSDPVYVRTGFGIVLIISIIGYFPYRRWASTETSPRFTPVI